MQERLRDRIIDVHLEAKLLPFCKLSLRDVLMIMRDSGMRHQKEVFTMRWKHVDRANNGYLVYDSKSRKGRGFVPMTVMGHTTVSTTMKHPNIRTSMRW